MNQLEKDVLAQIKRDLDNIFTVGPSFDDHMKMTSTGDAPGLAEDPKYKLGWQRCAHNARTLLKMLGSSAIEQRKYLREISQNKPKPPPQPQPEQIKAPQEAVSNAENQLPADEVPGSDSGGDQPGQRDHPGVPGAGL